jgi:lysophospholipase L1-like esterase
MKCLMLGAFVLFMFGCDRAGTTQPRQPVAGDLRFLALGDSYTIGESVAADDRWPMQLAASLRAEGISVADPTIIAQTGWTTANLSDAIDRAKPVGPYPLVGLLIGVNNQFQGRGADEYRKQYADLVQRSIGFAGGDASHVIVLSIPDWGATPFAAGQDRAKIGAEIDRFNAICREETVRAGARYVDVTPISRQAPKDAALVAEDGLHPSAKMYAEWVKLALPEAKAALR